MICSIVDLVGSELCEIMGRRLREEMERKATALALDPSVCPTNIK